VTVKIGILTTIHPSYDARIFERTVIPLMNAGFQVEVISAWEPHSSYSNIIWTTFNSPNSRIERVAHAWRLFLAALRSKSQSIHFHDIDFAPFAFLLKLCTNKKIIYDCHENYPEEIIFGKPWIRKELRHLIASIVDFFEKFFIRFYDRVIVVVPSTAHKFLPITKKVTIIRNLSVYEPNKDLSHQKNILYTGTVSENYGGNYILQLAEKIKEQQLELKILVFDKFDETYKDFFIQQVQQKGLPIQIRGRFRRNEILQVMSLGSVGLSFSLDTPSNNLGYPTKLFEYMSFGIPVVASDTLRHQQILHISNSGILVNHNDMDDVLSKITDLMDNPLHLEQLRENGFRAIQNDFNWRLEEKKLIEVYHNLFEEK